MRMQMYHNTAFRAVSDFILSKVKVIWTKEDDFENMIQMNRAKNNDCL